MLTGNPPFASKDKRLVLKRLLTKAIPMPMFLSAEAQSLLNALFKLNPSERLGFKEGAAEIKRHKFFKGIDFDALYHKRIKPPMSFQRKDNSPGRSNLDLNRSGFENWKSWEEGIKSQ